MTASYGTPFLSNSSRSWSASVDLPAASNASRTALYSTVFGQAPASRAARFFATSSTCRAALGRMDRAQAPAAVTAHRSKWASRSSSPSAASSAACVASATAIFANRSRAASPSSIFAARFRLSRTATTPSLA